MIHEVRLMLPDNNTDCICLFSYDLYHEILTKYDSLEQVFIYYSNGLKVPAYLCEQWSYVE